MEWGLFAIGFLYSIHLEEWGLRKLSFTSVLSSSLKRESCWWFSIFFHLSCLVPLFNLRLPSRVLESAERPKWPSPVYLALVIRWSLFDILLLLLGSSLLVISIGLNHLDFLMDRSIGSIKLCCLKGCRNSIQNRQINSTRKKGRACLSSPLICEGSELNRTNYCRVLVLYCLDTPLLVCL